MGAAVVNASEGEPERRHNTARDLAKAVYDVLQDEVDPPPTLALLEDIFETLFYVSLETEEGYSITCQIIFMDPADPSLRSEEPLPHHHWRFTPLVEARPFGQIELSKLARATDPRSSSIVVYPGPSNVLEILGLVDQGNSFLGFLRHEQHVGLRPPGLFHAGIEGVGRVVAYRDLRKLAELRGVRPPNP